MENYQYFAHVTEETLLKYCKDIFMAAGMREEDAACVADNLVFADCCGMESHGVIRVPAYTKRLQDHVRLQMLRSALKRTAQPLHW